MQGSNARKSIVVGLCFGLAGLTGCQNMRGKLHAPKLAMPNVSMPKVKMPNLMAWRDKDDPAVLTSTAPFATDPPTPSMNATPYAAYGAAGNNRGPSTQGISPVSYPATPFGAVQASGSPAGSGSRNPNSPNSPNYQVGPYGVTTPPQASPPAAPSHLTAPPSGNAPAPAAASTYTAPTGSNTPLSGSHLPPAAGNESASRAHTASQWENLPATPPATPAATANPAASVQQAAPASRWDHLDPVHPPQAYQPPSGSATAAPQTTQGAPVPNSPVSNPVSMNPVSQAAGLDTSAVSAANWQQPPASDVAAPAPASAADAAAIAKVSHADPVPDKTQRPDMSSYSDHVAAQGSMPWRPGSTDSYAQSTAANIAGAIRTATAQAAEAAAGPSQASGGSWPAADTHSP